MTTAISTTPRETLADGAARRLRGLLAEHRISGSALARAIGIQQSAMSRRMLGRTDMTLPEIEAICAAAGFSPLYLVFGEGAPVADARQLARMRAEQVPPAGFEPAAFCSQARTWLHEPSGFRLVMGGAA